MHRRIPQQHPEVARARLTILFNAGLSENLARILITHVTVGSIEPLHGYNDVEYRFTPNLALGFGDFSLGRADDSFGGVETEINVRGFELFGRVIYPVSKSIEDFGRITDKGSLCLASQN